jgi:hypothetical protein
MPKRNEKGHAKNLENLKKARDFAVSWGAKYAPSNPLLLLTNLNAVVNAAEAVADDLQAARTPYRNATAAAEDAFTPLSRLATRLVRGLEASGVPESVVEDARTYSRKIRGKRLAPAIQDDPDTPDIDESESSHSASQMSRAQRIENLDALILLVEAQALYDPNENDLKVVTLTNLSTDLKAKTQTVSAAFIPYSNKMGERDEIYYADKTGVVDIGNLFKKYVSSFGLDSVEYNQVKDLEFNRYKRR